MPNKYVTHVTLCNPNVTLGYIGNLSRIQDKIRRVSSGYVTCNPDFSHTPIKEFLLENLTILFHLEKYPP